jgi:hypothetical protein
MPLVATYLIWSIYRALTLRDVESHFDLVGAFALFGVYAFARLFPLKAQDRVIRLEERLRLTRVLPADLVARLEEITPRQLVALRFAPDAELEELVREILAGRLTGHKEIKQRITQWRPDHFRV